jgi:hypothetical protein
MLSFCIRKVFIYVLLTNFAMRFIFKICLKTTKFISKLLFNLSYIFVLKLIIINYNMYGLICNINIYCIMDCQIIPVMK